MWHEVDEFVASDGKSGWIAYENEETTEYQAFHWSERGLSCLTPDDARAAARATFEEEQNDA